MNKKEIECVSKACEISDKIYKIFFKSLKKGLFNTEKEAYDFLVKQAKDFGCRLSFKPIVAIGKNAAEIHHKADDSKLTRGFLVVDFGVKYKGYCSDCTRTFFLGNIRKKERELYDHVLRCQITAIEHISKGMYCHDLDALARGYFNEFGLMGNFVHGLGHGVGKKIHQSPSLHPKSIGKISDNVTLTIEPGLYFKNKSGIRIEDTVLLKKEVKILTKFPKKLFVIKT